MFVISLFLLFFFYVVYWLYIMEIVDGSGEAKTINLFNLQLSSIYSQCYGLYYVFNYRLIHMACKCAVKML